MPYLFQISIGPVQTFIASARRTRDLWFGSWLLSELAKAAAQKIVQQAGADSLIFPAPADIDQVQPGTVLNVANKIVATVKQPPETIGSIVEAAVQARLMQIWKQAREQVKGELENDTIAEAQIRDMVECFWVALPLPNEAAYADVRTSLEALMAARKNTRDFAAVTWGDYRPKSSITGHLEAVIPEGLYPVQRRDQNGERERKARVLLERYGAGPAERLSGVDLLKRHGQRNQEQQNDEKECFLSTSHIAAIPFLTRLNHVPGQVEARQRWHTYLEALKQLSVRIEHIPHDAIPISGIVGDCDGAMLFEERLDSEVVDTSSLKPAKERLHQFFKYIDSQTGSAGRPSPYYAILHADGDGMGAVIDEQARHGPAQHRELSRALDRFADNAGNIVAQHRGALIYSGGDDVLAFLPLHTLLLCAQELADTFKEHLKHFHDKNGRSPTLSVGIAVVHHLMPLSDALNLARDAEKSAKQVDGKNALAITVSKRSGGETTVRGQWGTFNTWLHNLIEWNTALPHGAAYELRDLAERLNVPQEERTTSFGDMMNCEVGRILKRKRSDGGMREIPPKVLNALQQHIQGSDAITTVRNLADELIVARLLADAARLAEPAQEVST
jgi:CRISPR-associated protein Cmr2